MNANARAGFSLLEVLIALAILAVSLTALFSSEAGAVKMAYRARRIGTATLLARCKMGEIEEQVALEGLPAVSDTGTDACCEDAEVDGFTCDWEIERIVIPETMFTPEEDEEGALAGTKTQGESPVDIAKNALGGDPMTALMGGGASGQAASNLGMGSITGMAMSYAYPILKPSFEEQIRRATVTVRWSEGSHPMAFDVTQYLVAEQPTNALNPNAPGGAIPGLGGATPQTPLGGALIGNPAASTGGKP